MPTDEVRLNNQYIYTIIDGIVVNLNFVISLSTLFNRAKDIHTANERRLCELIGHEIGGKLHTARSRNDQVQTDVHLWLRKATKILQRKIIDILAIIADHASQHIDLLMPSYTHLQPAQIIRYRKGPRVVC